MRRLVSLAVLIVVVLGSPLVSSAGVEPSPFYTVRPDLDALRARFTRVEGTYAAYPELLALATRVSASVPLIHAGALEPWVTDPLRVQGLGIINHITSMLDASAPPTPDVAARLLGLAGLIADGMTVRGAPARVGAPRALLAMGHVSQGLGWNDDDLHLTTPNAAAFDIMARITAVMFAPQPEPPLVVAEGISAIERIAAVLFAAPEPPKAVSQPLVIMDRLTSVLGAPQVGTPDVAVSSLTIMERLAAAAFGSEAPTGVEVSFDLLERIAAVLFAPQPEPPLKTQAINVMERIAAVLFAPQPEPPLSQPYMGLTSFDADVITVVCRAAGISEWAEQRVTPGDTIPGITGLTQLSRHLVSAVGGGQADRAAAHLGAMLEISQAYVY